jgi:predicted KAP-like P-loop ATPase
MGEKMSSKVSHPPHQDIEEKSALLPRLAPDRPIYSPDDDELNVKDFAKNQADKIVNRIPFEDGYVVGFYGEWGSGKSSILNFVRHHIGQLYKTKELEKERYEIIEYNPWWYSSTEELTIRLFEQLSEALGRSLSGDISIENRFKKLMRSLAYIASAAPGFSGAKNVGDLLEPVHLSVPELKKRISEILNHEKVRIYVFIDDIDRLAKQEVLDLFRVLKVVADLPYIIYCLAFDNRIVANALKSQYVSGDRFLEKIVGTHVHIPPLDRLCLQKMFDEKLEEHFGIRKSAIHEVDRLWEFREDAIELITTPRQLIRFFDAVSLSYAGLKGEVAITDLLGIEFLRLFFPTIYEEIKKSRSLLCGSHIADFEHKKDKAGLDAWTDRMFGKTDPTKQENAFKNIDPSKRSNVESILSNMFPIFNWAQKRNESFPTAADSWRKELRICGWDKFDTYFREGVSYGSASQSELRDLINLSDKPEDFKQRLRGYLDEASVSHNSSKCLDVLVYLRDFDFSLIPEDQKSALVKAMIEVGDELTRNLRQSIRNASDQVILPICSILKNLPEESNLEALQGGITNANEPWFVVEMIRHLELEYEGDFGRISNNRTVSPETLNTLKQEAIRKIESNSDTLFSAWNFRKTLLNWETWCSESFRKWLSEQLKCSDNTIMLLRSWLPESDRTVWADDPKPIHTLIDDLQAFKKVLNNLCVGNNLDDLDRERIELVLRSIK